MNPAWSVIGFTTLAGAAQGLVVALAILMLLGAELAPGLQRGLLGLATGLLVLALASSFLHLGRPERAWRAAAMWRTSWLSREVIVLPLFTAAVAAAALFAPVPAWAWAALIVGAALLWWCTAMIYACLRFIQEWAHGTTLAGYMLIGLATGAVLLGASLVALGKHDLAQALLPWALAMTAAAWAVRALALQRNATLRPKSTLQSATGIRAATLRQISMGMTGGSFNTREFFHHARSATLPRLKWLFQALLFALPLALLGAAWFGAGPWTWWLALAAMAPGVAAERWLFFAQARHPQNLYYQVVS